jgi:hypothetical protein
MSRETVKDIVSDEELVTAFGNANFGACSSRDILRYAVLKCVCGYYQGFTSRTIARELGLITEKYNITKKGKNYLWAAFKGDKIV